MQCWRSTIWLLVAFTLGVFAARLTNAPIVLKFYAAQPPAILIPAPAKPRLPITSL